MSNVCQRGLPSRPTGDLHEQRAPKFSKERHIMFSEGPMICAVV